MLVSPTTQIQKPHANMPIPRGGILLYEQNSDVNTRIEWGWKRERLYAHGRAVATYDSLSAATTAAKLASAGNAPGVVILQDGTQFAVHGALLVTDVDTESSTGRSWYKQDPQILDVDGSRLSTWNELEQLAPNFAAVVDGDFVLKPGAYEFGGTRLISANG